MEINNKFRCVITLHCIFCNIGAAAFIQASSLSWTKVTNKELTWNLTFALVLGLLGLFFFRILMRKTPRLQSYTACYLIEFLWNVVLLQSYKLHPPYITAEHFLRRSIHFQAPIGFWSFHHSICFIDSELGQDHKKHSNSLFLWVTLSLYNNKVAAGMQSSPATHWLRRSKKCPRLLCLYTTSTSVYCSTPWFDFPVT